MSFEEFQDWRPSWISERKDLAILNLHVATMLPSKFQLIPTYTSGGDVENVKR